MPADPPPRSAPSELRVSDTDRHAMVRRLAEHAGAGRLTLDELEERSSVVLAARTRGELDAVTADLPAAAAGDEPRRRKATKWVVSLLGAADKRGRWRVGRKLKVIALLGGNDLDLRHAELDGDEIRIVALALCGGINLYLPDSVEVDSGGFAMLGSNEQYGSVRVPRDEAPRITVMAYSLCGGVDIWRLPEAARGVPLKHARRLAKRAGHDA